MIKISIVDDSPVYVAGEKMILSSDPELEIINVSSTGEAFRCFIEASDTLPDIVLLDISLEKVSTGLTVAEWLQNQYPEIKVIIFSQFKRKDFLIRAVQANVRAYLAKDSASEELLRIIHMVYEGKGLYLGETVPFKMLLDAFGNEANIEKGKPQNLNQNELSILNYTANGLSSKEIAAILDISPNTVDTHKERIRVKLGARNIIEAIMISLKKGILSISDE